jgi:hypothetical protein
MFLRIAVEEVNYDRIMRYSSVIIILFKFQWKPWILLTNRNNKINFTGGVMNYFLNEISDRLNIRYKLI